MLPELPFTLVLYLVYIVVGYPIRIVVENRSTKVLLLKLIIGVNDGLDMITVFHDVKPSQHIALKFLHTLISRLVFYVENRRKVAFCKMHFIEEEISLFACRRLVAPEVVNASDKAIIACLIKVFSEILVKP